MKSGHLRSLAVVVASATVSCAALVLPAASAHAATASSVDGYQLQQDCWAKGNRDWTLGNGVTLEIPTEQDQPGSQGVCVKWAQLLLQDNYINHGIDSPYQSLAIDGDFGRNTEAATIGIQKWWAAHGMTWCGPADGIVGPRTWGCLEWATVG